MNIKLLQWNIWIKEKIEHIVKEIKRLDPDIICLQELTRECEYNRFIDTPDYIANRLGFDYFFYEAQSWEKGPTKSQGNGIFSRWPIEKSSYTYIQQPPSSSFVKNSSAEGRVYIQAEIQTNSELLTVGTTHLSFTKFFTDVDLKKRQIDVLINSIKKNSRYFVFAGDLNSPPESYVVPQLTKMLNHAGPSFEQKTWATKIHDKDGFRVDSLQYRLDYVFATKDLQVKSAKIVQTDYSDHLPVLVEFDV